MILLFDTNNNLRVSTVVLVLLFNYNIIHTFGMYYRMKPHKQNTLSTHIYNYISNASDLSTIKESCGFF